MVRLEILPLKNVISTENTIFHNLGINGHECGDLVSLTWSVFHSHGVFKLSSVTAPLLRTEFIV